MDSSSLHWTQIIVTAAITTLLSVAGSIFYFHYTDRSPDLYYEIFPAASFVKDEIEVGIQTATIQNIGDKEADDVQVYFELAANTAVQDLKVEPSSPAIRSEITRETNSIEFAFPRLNPTESVRFSLLFEKGRTGVSQVAVRAKGINGRTGPKESDDLLSKFLAVVASIVGAALGALVMFLSRSSLEIGLSNIFAKQQKVVDEELRQVRTRGNDEVDLEKLLQENRYRLYFNPAIPGDVKSKIMVFGDGGRILEGRNRNENSWRISDDFLELVDSDGLVHSRFYYSASNHSFYHTNDNDTGSIRKHNIRDQYMVPERNVGA